MEEWAEVRSVKGGRLVAIVVDIRRNATGEVREYETHQLMMDGADSPDEYIWSDGDYGCDCNRRLFFARAAGDDEDWDSLCSEGLYSVRVRNKKSGRVWYSEFDA